MEIKWKNNDIAEFNNRSSNVKLRDLVEYGL